MTLRALRHMARFMSSLLVLSIWTLCNIPLDMIPRQRLENSFPGRLPEIVLNLDCSFPIGKGEIKRWALAQFRFHPDPAPMKFDDPLDESEPNTRALAARIQLVEQAKYSVTESRIDPNPVIACKENRRAILSQSRLTDLNLRLWLVPHEFGCVIDQVLPDLEQTRPVAI